MYSTRFWNLLHDYIPCLILHHCTAGQTPPPGRDNSIILGSRLNQYTSPHPARMQQLFLNSLVDGGVMNLLTVTCWPVSVMMIAA